MSRARKGETRAPSRTPLKLLLVEDSENDAVLLLRELRRGGYEPVCERVETPEDMEAALREADRRGEPREVVISDYYMPRFRAPEALALLEDLGYDLPFIVVSGKVGEDLAVEVMRAGAHDYITKENMARLNPAVERALREAEVRRERRRAEEAFRRSENRFRRLVEQATDAIFVHDLEGRFVDVNRAACESLGRTRQELLGMSVPDIEVAFDTESARELWRDISAGSPRTLEGCHRRKDGTTFPVEVRVGLFESDGESLLTASARDITARWRAEVQLKESEVRFRATFEQAAVGIVQVALDAGWVRVNDRFCEITGYTREELGEVGVFDLLSPEDLPTDYDRGVRMLAGELREYTEEKRIVGKGGRRIWINLTVSLVHDASDEPRYFIAVVEDIGKRKRAEEDLRLRDRAITASPNGIIITDPNQPDSPIVYVNPGFELITGYPAEEAVGRNCRFLQGDDRDQPALEELRQAIGEQRYCTVVLRNYRKDGSLFWNELSVSPVWDERGNLTHFIGVQNDITDRKAAEDALRESEERFRTLTSNASDIVLILDRDGTIRYESPAVERILGYKPEERVGKRAFDLLHPDDVEPVRRAFIEYLQTPGVNPPVEYRTLARDGTWHHFEAVGNNLLHDPSVQGIVINSRDVTERKRAEKELALSEEKYRTLFETMIQGIVYQNAEGQFTSANPAAGKMLGFFPEQIRGKTPWDLPLETIREDGSDFPPEEYPIVLALETGEKVEDEIIGVFLPEEGAYRWISVDAVPQFRPGESRPYQSYAIFEDITARKEVEEAMEKVREVERDRIARDLHDDVLQNMVYALQEAQILQATSENGGNDELGNIADALRQSVEGLRGSIFELRLTGSSSQSFTDSLQYLLEMNRRMSRGRYSLELSVESGFPEDIPEAEGRQITRIIQEALNNVRRHAGARHARVELGCESGLVRVEVVDDGRGFDVEAVSGAGQQLMRQRAEEIGGRLEVESVPEAGSTVRLEIPISRLTHEPPSARSGHPNS